MQRRWLAGVAIAAAAGVAFVATRGGGDGAPRTSASAPARRTAPAPVHARRVEQPGRVYVSGAGDASPGVKKWQEPGLPGTFREVVAPDDSENVEEKLLYKQRRLRFRLNDAAGACYDGGDGKEAVSLAYTLVIERGELRVESVRVLTSNLSDLALQQCIVDAVRTLRSDAGGLPDLRQDQRTTISQHDLYVRNRSVN